MKEKLASETNSRTKRIYASVIKSIEGTAGTFELAIDNTQPSQGTVGVILRADYKYYNGHRRIDMVANSGILPIRVDITNNTTSAIKIDPDSINLFDLNNVRANMPYQTSVSSEQKASMAQTFIFGVPGLSQARTAVANVRIERYFKENLFKKIDLVPGGSYVGYMYYEVPKGTRDIKNWEIKLTVNANDIYRKVGYKF